MFPSSSADFSDTHRTIAQQQNTENQSYSGNFSNPEERPMTDITTAGSTIKDDYNADSGVNGQSHLAENIEEDKRSTYSVQPSEIAAEQHIIESAKEGESLPNSDFLYKGSSAAESKPEAVDAYQWHDSTIVQAPELDSTIATEPAITKATPYNPFTQAWDDDVRAFPSEQAAVDAQPLEPQPTFQDPSHQGYSESQKQPYYSSNDSQQYYPPVPDSTSSNYAYGTAEAQEVKDNSYDNSYGGSDFSVLSKIHFSHVVFFISHFVN